MMLIYRTPSAAIHKSEEVRIPAPFVASFSSRGPNPGSHHLLKVVHIMKLVNYAPCLSLDLLLKLVSDEKKTTNSLI